MTKTQIKAIIEKEFQGVYLVKNTNQLLVLNDEKLKEKREQLFNAVINTYKIDSITKIEVVILHTKKIQFDDTFSADIEIWIDNVNVIGWIKTIIYDWFFLTDCKEVD